MLQNPASIINARIHRSSTYLAITFSLARKVGVDRRLERNETADGDGGGRECETARHRVLVVQRAYALVADGTLIRLKPPVVRYVSPRISAPRLRLLPALHERVTSDNTLVVPLT